MEDVTAYLGFVHEFLQIAVQALTAGVICCSVALCGVLAGPWFARRVGWRWSRLRTSACRVGLSKVPLRFPEPSLAEEDAIPVDVPPPTPATDDTTVLLASEHLPPWNESGLVDSWAQAGRQGAPHERAFPLAAAEPVGVTGMDCSATTHCLS